MKLGITDNLRPKPSFDNYFRWIHRIDPQIEVVKLSYHLKNEKMLGEVDGLMLTGGGDVHPALYGRPDAIGKTEEVNELRDDFEFRIIEQALEREMPILGICRGMQIMNVYLGGSLVIDLPSAGFRSHVIRDGADFRHDLVTEPRTMLESISGPGPHKVNSIHHQAVDNLGKGLMVAARSDDGVVESVEWVMKDRMPFLLLMQWHPERMANFDNPCSGRIAEYFIKEVTRFSTNTDHIIDEKETERSHHG